MYAGMLVKNLLDVSRGIEWRPSSLVEVVSLLSSKAELNSVFLWSFMLIYDGLQKRGFSDLTLVFVSRFYLLMTELLLSLCFTFGFGYPLRTKFLTCG